MADTLIIGGTAAYHLDLPCTREEMVETPFGPAGPVLFFDVAGRECAFLSRHGGQGRLGVTPPFINYRANLWVARQVGARRVLSWNSVGSLVAPLEPGSIVVVSDLIDWSRRRPSTFGQYRPAVEAREQPLFDPALRQALVAAGRSLGRKIAPRAVYAATEGARLETAAEIQVLAQAGAELVGMTLAPEVFLARELGVSFASLCWVSNYATGIPYDGPERRLFGPEVGPLMLEIILTMVKEETAGDGTDHSA